MEKLFAAYARELIQNPPTSPDDDTNAARLALSQLPITIPGDKKKITSPSVRIEAALNTDTGHPKRQDAILTAFLLVNTAGPDSEPGSDAEQVEAWRIALRNLLIKPENWQAYFNAHAATTPRPWRILAYDLRSMAEDQAESEDGNRDIPVASLTFKLEVTPV